MKLRTALLSAGLCLMISAPALAGPDDFRAGTAIAEYGKIADVVSDQPFSKRTKFKVVFDAAKPGTPGEVNRSFNSLARFINMHHAQGVPVKNIKLALVLHGGAAKDVTRDSYYIGETEKNVDGKTEQIGNANAPLIKALLENGVEIYVCGQTAAYYDIKNEDLLPGVKMSLSAMTAHALLQQKGYTLNPF